MTILSKQAVAYFRRCRCAAPPAGPRKPNPAKVSNFAFPDWLGGGAPKSNTGRARVRLTAATRLENPGPRRVSGPTFLPTNVISIYRRARSSLKPIIYSRGNPPSVN